MERRAGELLERGARVAAARRPGARPRLGHRTPLGPVGARAGARRGHRRRERHPRRGTAADPRSPTASFRSTTGTFSAALLCLHARLPARPGGRAARRWRASPADPSSSCSRSTPSRLGYAWLRVREFFWTIVAFHVSRLVGYVSADATFTHAAPGASTPPRRFGASWRRPGCASARGESGRCCPDAPCVVAGWVLERDD